MERFSIICLSTQEWRVDLPTNRQQIMLRAARRGHDVLFIETGHFLGRHLWALVRRPGRRSLARRLLSGERVASRVRVRKAVNIVPWGSSRTISSAVNSGLTAGLLRLSSARSRPVVLWIYDPGFVRMAGMCGEEFAVYDCVDDYVEQTTSKRKRQFVALSDRMAARRSRLVFTTTKTLYERQRLQNRKTHLVSNAGDYQHFAKANDRSIVAADVSELSRPVLGFAGNLLPSKVDFDLLAALARARPDWTVLLVGPAPRDSVARLAELATMPNVFWVGSKPYSELPRYVAAFDVGLIPYVSSAYTRSCFPLKLYEYLAAGKPVVAAGLPELAGMEPDVTLVSGVDEAAEAVERALRRDDDVARTRRVELAARNSWDVKTDRLLQLVADELTA